MVAENRAHGQCAIHPATMLEIAPEVMSRSSGPEVVLLEPSSEQFFGLDDVGARVFELLATRRRFSDLVDILTAEYDVDPQVLENDVRRFVEELAEAKLVRTATD